MGTTKWSLYQWTPHKKRKKNESWQHYWVSSCTCHRFLAVRSTYTPPPLIHPGIRQKASAFVTGTTSYIAKPWKTKHPTFIQKLGQSPLVQRNLVSIFYHLVPYHIMVRVVSTLQHTLPKSPVRSLGFPHYFLEAKTLTQLKEKEKFLELWECSAFRMSISGCNRKKCSLPYCSTVASSPAHSSQLFNFLCFKE